MMLFNEVPNLRRHLGSVPAHDEHLPNGPRRGVFMSIINLRLILDIKLKLGGLEEGKAKRSRSDRHAGARKGAEKSEAYQSRSSHIGSDFTSRLLVDLEGIAIELKGDPLHLNGSRRPRARRSHGTEIGITLWPFVPG